MVSAERVSSCLVSDLSWSGAPVWVGDASRVPERFELRIERHGITHVAELRWRTSDEVGVEFIRRQMATRYQLRAGLRTQSSVDGAPAYGRNGLACGAGSN
jgi:hypothetical protein